MQSHVSRWHRHSGTGKWEWEAIRDKFTSDGDRFRNTWSGVLPALIKPWFVSLPDQPSHRVRLAFTLHFLPHPATNNPSPLVILSSQVSQPFLYVISVLPIPQWNADLVYIVHVIGDGRCQDATANQYWCTWEGEIQNQSLEEIEDPDTDISDQCVSWKFLC